MVSFVGFSASLFLETEADSALASASIDCCFRDLVTLRFALPLLLITPRGVPFLPVFVGDAGRFPLAFRAGFDLGVGRIILYMTILVASETLLDTTSPVIQFRLLVF